MTADESDNKQSQSEQDIGNEQEAVSADQQAQDLALDEAIQEAVETALAGQRDMVVRAQAEVQNMRRRCEQDVEKAHKFALEKFAMELLGVADNLERALQAASEREDERVGGLVEGVELTLKGLLEVFARFNISKVDPQGEPFDPQLHEAMSTQPSAEVEPNTVLAVVQKGYTLNGRVLRPAMVMVSKSVDS